MEQIVKINITLKYSNEKICGMSMGLPDGVPVEDAFKILEDIVEGYKKGSISKE